MGDSDWRVVATSFSLNDVGDLGAIGTARVLCTTGQAWRRLGSSCVMRCKNGEVVAMRPILSKVYAIARHKCVNFRKLLKLKR